MRSLRGNVEEPIAVRGPYPFCVYSFTIPAG
jgi:hypothetical protein